MVVFLCLCFCGGRGGGGGVFEVFLCFCDGVFVCFFWSKSVDNTGVKRCLV